jgi:hypothetical protein
MAQTDTRPNRLPALIPGEAPRDTQPRTGVFAAQLLGQQGQRRGLKGGAPVLGAARGAYLAAEFAGENERRPAPGLVKVATI